MSTISATSAPAAPARTDAPSPADTHAAPADGFAALLGIPAATATDANPPAADRDGEGLMAGQAPLPGQSLAAAEVEGESPQREQDAVDAADEDDDWPPLGLSALPLAAAEPAPPVTAPVAGGGAAARTRSVGGNDGPATPTLGQLMAANAEAANAPAAPPSFAANAQATTAAATQAAEAAMAPAGAGNIQEAARPSAGIVDARGDSAFGTVLHGLGMTGIASTPIALDAPVATAPTATPVLGSEGFDDAIADRVGWLVDQKIGQAHIRISPDALGTIEVTLQLDGDNVQASFTSAHAEVRHALEAGLGRLRELLGEQGLQLTQADVGQRGNPQADARGHDQPGTRGGHAQPGVAGNQRDASPAPPPPSAALQRLRLLDTYA